VWGAGPRGGVRWSGQGPRGGIGVGVGARAARGGGHLGRDALFLDEPSEEVHRRVGRGRLTATDRGAPGRVPRATGRGQAGPRGPAGAARGGDRGPLRSRRESPGRSRGVVHAERHRVRRGDSGPGEALSGAGVELYLRETTRRAGCGPSRGTIRSLGAGFDSGRPRTPAGAVEGGRPPPGRRTGSVSQRPRPVTRDRRAGAPGREGRPPLLLPPGLSPRRRSLTGNAGPRLPILPRDCTRFVSHGASQ